MLTQFGEAWTLYARAVTGQDADGNDVYTTTSTAFDSVPTWPRNASELVQGEDLTITGLTIALPAGSDATAIDYLIRTKTGLKYEVDGEPGDAYQSPITGWDPGVIVNLTRVA